MESKIIYENLKRLFPNDVENINLRQLPRTHSSFNQFLEKVIGNQLPHISCQQLHLLCQNQQKNVMNKLIEIKQVDIYQEIANVCPAQRNLKDLSVEQISRKISDYSDTQSERNATKSRGGPLRDITYESDYQEHQSMEEESFQMLGEKDIVELKIQNLEIGELDSYNYHPHDDVYHKNLLDDFDEQKNDHFLWGNSHSSFDFGHH